MNLCSKFYRTILHLMVQVIVLLSISNAQAWRVGTPNQNWSKVSTLHFDFIFAEQDLQLALYYAQFAETQLAELKKTFVEVPETITVIINDSTDSSNGYATVIPYPHIMIYPVQVGEDTALSEGSSWAKELFVHELTHILQMHPSRGFYRFIRPIFGTIISPNLLLPSWWKEGMAVEVETQFSSSGRLRSHYQSATTRALYQDQKLQNYTLAQANENILRWPYGNLPYYMGSYLMSELASDREFQSLGRLTSRQAERAPFFIEAPIIEITGGSYQALFHKTQSNLLEQAQDQIGALQSTDLTNGSLVAPKLRSSRWPRYSKNGKYLALIGSNETETQIYILEKKSLAWEPADFKKLPTGEIESLIWSIDSKRIFYTKFDRLKRNTNFTDIFVYDLAAEKSYRVSENLRARQLALSDDGSLIAFINSGQGRTAVQMISLPPDNNWKDFKPNQLVAKTIHTESFDSRINGVGFIGSDKLFVSIRDANSQQTQMIKSIESGTSKTLAQLPLATDLRYPNIQGDSIYFISAKSGVMNIYQSKISNPKTISPITNVLTGVQSFDVEPNKKSIVYTQITSNGFQVFESPWPLGSIELKKIENPIAERYSNSFGIKASLDQNSAPLVLKSEAETYSPWGFLIPRYWIPFIATSSSEDGFYLQALTSGFDPLQTHGYQIVFNYDTALKRAGYNLLYSNHVAPWPVQLTADQTQQFFGTSTNIIEKRSATLSLQPDLFRFNKNINVAIGPQYLGTGIEQNAIPFTEHIGLAVTSIYSTIEQKPWHYHPMHGWSGIARLEWNKAVQDWGPGHPSFGRLTVGATKYWSDALPKDHALFFKTNLAYIPENVATRYGSSSVGVSASADTSRPEFLLRGYGSGRFFGTQLATVTSEYRMPLMDIFRGSGSDPFFIKYMTAAAVLDGLTVKGQGLTESQTLRVLPFGPSYWSAGAEIRMNTTVGYLLPLNFVIGAYVPFSPEFSQSASLGLSLQIGGAGLGVDEH